MAKKRKDRHRNIPINLRIPEELDAKLRERAKQTRRTLTTELIIALEKYLEQPAQGDK
jgi:predicted DNA-binding protein